MTTEELGQLGIGLFRTKDGRVWYTESAIPGLRNAKAGEVSDVSGIDINSIPKATSTAEENSFFAGVGGTTGSNYGNLNQLVSERRNSYAIQKQTQDQANSGTRTNENVKGPDIGGLGGVPMTPEQIKATQPATNPTTLTSQTNPQQAGTKYIQFVGSPDVFDSTTGKLVTYAEAQQIPGFFQQVQKINTPRPEVKTAEDYATFNGKSLSLNALPEVQKAIQGGGVVVSNNTQDQNYHGGIPDDQWNLLTADQRALFNGLDTVKKSEFAAGLLSESINGDMLNKALKAAQEDPTILAKYGDAVKIAQSDLQKNLGLVNDDYAQKFNQQTLAQAQEKETQQNNEAAAGRAYSGFRQKAQNQLASEHTGVIQSTKRELQNKLNTAGSGLEAIYGSAGLGQFAPIQAQYGGETIAYNPMGGIIGSEVGAKKEDILNKQKSIFNMQKLTA